MGARLEEMMQEDKQHIPNIVAMLSDESKQKQLLLEDEEENFLDECKKVQQVITYYNILHHFIFYNTAQF